MNRLVYIKRLYILCVLVSANLLSSAQWNNDTISGGNHLIRNISKTSKQISVADRTGGNFVVFEKAEIDAFGYTTGRHAICLQQINSNGQTQFGTLDSGTVLIPTAGVRLSDMVSDSNGGFYFAYRMDIYSSNDQFLGTSLFVQRVNASGTLVWSGNGTEIFSTLGYYEYEPTLISLPANQVAVAWVEPASDSYNGYLRVQKLSGTGQLQWGTFGTRVSNNPVGYVHNFSVTNDGSGGLLFTYEDDRNAPPLPTPGQEFTDLFFQRVRSNGTLALDPNGVPVFVENFDQMLPLRDGKQRTSFPDGSGGQYILYGTALNENSDSTDIYVQRISATGQKLFAGNGVKIAQDGQDGYYIYELFLIPSENNSISCYFQRTNPDSFIFQSKLFYVQKINTSGQKFWNTTYGYLIDRAWSDDGEFTDPFDVAWDSAGNHMITYLRYIGDTSSQVVVQYLNAAGVKQLAASGKTILAASAVKLDINRNSDGYFMVNWQDLRNYPESTMVWDPPTDLFTKRINAQGQATGERRTIYSQATGNWNNPSTWQGGVVPTIADEVIVRHQVTVTAAAGSYSLRVETAAGRILVQAGMNLQVVH